MSASISTVCCCRRLRLLESKLWRDRMPTTFPIHPVWRWSSTGAAKHIDEQGRYLGTVQTFPRPDRADPRWAPSREPYLMHPFLMARRADLQAIGGYRYVYYSEDTDLCWRLQERGAMQNLDMPLGKCRMHARSLSSASVINGRACPSWGGGRHFCRARETVARSTDTSAH